MSGYEELKDRMLTGRTVATIEGVRLDRGQRKSWFPISPCICVTEPCPCDKGDDIIVWLPEGTEFEETAKMWGTEPVLSFTLRPDADIIVEMHVPMTVSRLHAIKHAAERKNRRTMAVLQRTASAKSKSKPTVGALMVGAFELGWSIGEKIDEETGASDKISDWLADNFPWPW